MNRYRSPPAVAHQLEPNRVADLVLIHEARKIISIVNLLTIDADNDIAQFEVAIFRLRNPMQTRVSGGAVGSHLHDQDAFGNREVHLIFQRGNIAAVDSQLGAAHRPETY